MLQELVIEYDEYVVDHILPMTNDWSLQGQDMCEQPVEDPQLAMMADILRDLRLYFHKTMADIVVSVALVSSPCCQLKTSGAPTALRLELMFSRARTILRS